MSFISVLLIALALAMDAFSIALSKGLGAKKVCFSDAIKLGIAFGAFQFIMPIIGFIVAGSFASFVNQFSGIISCILLCFIGAKLLYEAIKNDDSEQLNSSIDLKSLIVLGVATSIDALAVGITFAIDGNSFLTSLYYCSIIGIVSLVLSFLGYFIGNKLGEKIGDKGELIGGIVLIILGIKMLF